MLVIQCYPIISIDKQTFEMVKKIAEINKYKISPLLSNDKFCEHVIMHYIKGYC